MAPLSRPFFGRRRIDPLRAALGLALLASIVLGAFLGRRLVQSGSPGSWVERAPPDLSRYDRPLVRAAREFGVDPDLVRGLVAAESGGDASAQSGAPAYGLTQLTIVTAEEEAHALHDPTPSADDLKDPATNLRLGAKHLARLLAEFDGEEAFAVAAYNAGSTPIKRWRLRAPDVSARDAVLREGFSETRNHVTRTLRFRDGYRSAHR